MTALRIGAFVAGAALLAATAHVTIVHTGGYTASGAILTMAIALGVAAASVAIGAAWSSSARLLAGWLALAILAGEAFGFLMTADRLVTGRERVEAPLRAARQARAEAVKRVSVAEAAVAALPTTSDRLDSALQAKQAADTAIREKSAAPSCAQNCRLLLQGQVDAAAREVEDARSEIEAARVHAESELRDSRAKLADKVEPASATPLADRTGIPSWVLDLIVAGLGSLAANGLGVGLIAFAAHGSHREPPARAPVQAEPLPPERKIALAAVSARRPKLAARPAEHAAQFAVEALVPAADGGVDLLDIRRAYDSWCNSRGIEPLPAAKLGNALAKLFEGAGIAIAEQDGRRIALGIAMNNGSVRLEHMTS